MIKRTALKRSTKRIRARRSKPRRVDVDRVPAYVEFLHREGICAACETLHNLFLDVLDTNIPCWSPVPGSCVGAHTANNGRGSKGPDSSRAPLCHVHHMEYDRGRVAFERKYILDMAEIAAAWYWVFQKKGAKRG